MFHEIMIDLREYRLRRRRLKWSRLYFIIWANLNRWSPQPNLNTPKSKLGHEKRMKTATSTTVGLKFSKCALWSSLHLAFIAGLFKQTCHFDQTQNLNECEKKSEYTEKNLNLTTKIAFLYRNHYQIQGKKIWILSQVIWILVNFRKKIWMIQIKSEWFR